VDDFGYWAGCRKAMEDFAQARGLDMHVNAIDETGVWFAVS